MEQTKINCIKRPKLILKMLKTDRPDLRIGHLKCHSGARTNEIALKHLRYPIG